MAFRVSLISNSPNLPQSANIQLSYKLNFLSWTCVQLPEPFFLSLESETMSILANLARARETYQKQPLLISEAALIAEYDAAKRAYASALAHNNLEGALLWSARANDIAREIAELREQEKTAEDLSA